MGSLRPAAKCGAEPILSETGIREKLSSAGKMRGRPGNALGTRANALGKCAYGLGKPENAQTPRATEENGLATPWKTRMPWD
eukprot:1350344-Lingulodinium_polyedra.AAC.1